MTHTHTHTHRVINVVAFMTAFVSRKTLVLLNLKAQGLRGTFNAAACDGDNKGPPAHGVTSSNHYNSDLRSPLVSF